DIDIRKAGDRDKLVITNDNTNSSGSYSIVVPPGIYDISASGPPGAPYAAATARSVDATAGDTDVPNLVLPPGFEMRGTCRDTHAVAVAGVDVDVDSLPLIRRLETKNGISDATGLFKVMVSAWKFRVTLSPPVATKLIPVRYDSLQITGARDLGTITFLRGHWVSGTVVESGSHVPIPGANLDFIRKSNGQLAVTPGDATDGR